MSEPLAHPERAFRVWLALVAMPLLLAVCFSVTGAWLVATRGLEGDAVAKAIEAIAAYPTTFGFALALLATLRLAANDGFGWSELGWKRPTTPDLLVGIGAGALLWALNAVALHPLVRAFLPAFDPTLRDVSLPAALVTFGVASFAEDTLFRGYALRALQRRHGTAPAIAITTAVYALLAGVQGPALVAWAVYFGVVLCVIRLWRDSLWPVTIAHCMVALGPKLVS